MKSVLPPGMPPARFGASGSQKRIEDDRLLKGQGIFSDDRCFSDESALVVLRSPHAHANIIAIDTDGARSAPGVLAVLTAEDLAAAGVGFIPVPMFFKRSDGSPMAVPPRYALAVGKVFHVGQPVAAIVAKTRLQAQDAAEMVRVDYETLPPVVDARAAAAPDAPQVWEAAPGNVAAEARMGDVGATREAFAKAKWTARVELHNQRLVANAIEPRCSIGAVERGRLTLYTQNQTPTGARDLLAQVFGGKSEDFRVVIGDIGGGFGMKTGLAQEDVLVCHAARILGSPVRWRADRSEEFLNAHMGRDQHYEAELALGEDGKFLALRMRMLANVGAPTTGSSLFIPLMIGPRVQTTLYRIPVIDFHMRAMLTNTVATAAYRGAGRPEANYLMERLVETAAEVSGFDSVELRRRNFIPPEAFPFTTAARQTYDSGAFETILEQALQDADWSGFEARKEASLRRGRLRGRGLSCYIEWTGAVPTETVSIEIGSAGEVTVFTGTQAMGQGTETTFAQLAAEVFQLDISRIRIVQGDTDLATGQGSVGSRSAFVGGPALVRASRLALDHGRSLAAKEMEVAAEDVEYSRGCFGVVGTDRSLGLFDLVARQDGGVLKVFATESAGGASWPNGAQVCEVEIDPETGKIEVASLTSVDDIGRVLNQMIATGQVHGGIAQGLGQALMEGATYDPASGQLLTGSFLDYAVPRAADLPSISSRFDESIPCLTNLLGVKGVGEIGTVGAVPAVFQAVIDALGRRGGIQGAMPLTSEKVWRSLHCRAAKNNLIKSVI